MLDIASGAGRHSLYFAAQGHEVTAVDRDETALAALRVRDAEDAPKAGTIHTVVADLENQPWPFSQSFDGIVMTKFDTVDEKVGTALNMVYTTGKPIVFVGVGQKYPHLKKLNVQTVVNALMS